MRDRGIWEQLLDTWIFWTRAEWFYAYLSYRSILSPSVFIHHTQHLCHDCNYPWNSCSMMLSARSVMKLESLCHLTESFPSTLTILWDNMLVSVCLLGSNLNVHPKPENIQAVTRYNWHLHPSPKGWLDFQLWKQDTLETKFLSFWPHFPFLHTESQFCFS